ncbi:MAG: aspartate aminotransferase family protein [Myxococcales bacterium]|nr:aspartate aminotransferase family protein [Myxococcales bacterium]
MVRALPAAEGQRWVERLAATECPALTARRARRAEQSGADHDPILWSHSLGSNVWDMDGNRYVDLSAGFGAAALGHRHPAVLEALSQQAARGLHALGDLQPSDVKVELLERLCALSPFEDARAILGLSGSDAVGAALKTAALATGRPGVLAFEGGYHGLAYGSLAVCGYNPGFRRPFAEQCNPHVSFAAFPGPGDDAAEALSQIAASWPSSSPPGAVLIEPMLGRGGVVVPPPGFLQGLGELCRKRGALLIVDEVMTGLGRSGAWLCSVEQGARPDLVCLGKALGGGLPVSATLGSAQLMRAWGEPGGEALHTSTFAGNPLGAATALATLQVLEQQRLSERSAQLGQHLMARLSEALLGAPELGVREVRGRGLLVGIVCDSTARALQLGRALLQRGYITVPAGSDARVVSLTPALTIDGALLEAFVEATREALGELAARQGASP